jgi:hypothetical protein
VLELGPRPDGAHQSVAGVRVGPEQEMPDFVRGRKAEHHRGLGARLRGHPVHAIDVHRRQTARANTCIHQGVPELQPAA